MIRVNESISASETIGSASAVTFGEPGTAAASFQSSHLSRRSFDEVIARLRKEIDGAGLRLLHEIDPQKALQALGNQLADRD